MTLTKHIEHAVEMTKRAGGYVFVVVGTVSVFSPGYSDPIFYYKLPRATWHTTPLPDWLVNGVEQAKAAGVTVLDADTMPDENALKLDAVMQSMGLPDPADPLSIMGFADMLQEFGGTIYNAPGQVNPGKLPTPTDNITGHA